VGVERLVMPGSGVLREGNGADLIFIHRFDVWVLSVISFWSTPCGA
jgi:hypothetical protein